MKLHAFTEQELDEAFTPFAEQLRRTAARSPERPAVTFEDITLSYRELLDRSARLANALIELGVGVEDRVATLSPNRLESIEEVAGIAMAGAVRVPLYMHNTAPSHVHMLRVTGAKAAILDPTVLPTIQAQLHQLPDLRHLIVHDTAEADALEAGALAYRGIMSSARSEDPRVETGPESISIIRFSSGTTGLPKGIMHRQQRYFGTGEALARTLEDCAADTVQIISGPISHISGAFIWPMIERGAHQRIMPRFDPEAFIAHVEAGATVSLIVPTMLKAILEVDDIAQRNISSLRRLSYGGSPIDPATLRRAISVFGPIFSQSYGQSEASPITVLDSARHDMDAPGFDPKILQSAGVPVPGLRLRLVDEAGDDVPDGEVGEIAVRAPWTMNEIWGDEQATRIRHLPDGSLRTSDMGVLRDGVLFMADRKDDMIISGGFNIWPTELENALLEHPDVIEAGVVGTPHDRWGETPIAHVVLRDDATVTEEDLLLWTRERVGGVKKPSAVILRRDPLPRNGTGKLLRRVLRDERRIGGPVSSENHSGTEK